MFKSIPLFCEQGTYLPGADTVQQCAVAKPFTSYIIRGYLSVETENPVVKMALEVSFWTDQGEAVKPAASDNLIYRHGFEISPDVKTEFCHRIFVPETASRILWSFRLDSTEKKPVDVQAYGFSLSADKLPEYSCFSAFMKNGTVSNLFENRPELSDISCIVLKISDNIDSTVMRGLRQGIGNTISNLPALYSAKAAEFGLPFIVSFSEKELKNIKKYPAWLSGLKRNEPESSNG